MFSSSATALWINILYLEKTYSSLSMRLGLSVQWLNLVFTLRPLFPLKPILLILKWYKLLLLPICYSSDRLYDNWLHATRLIVFWMGKCLKIELLIDLGLLFWSHYTQERFCQYSLLSVVTTPSNIMASAHRIVICMATAVFAKKRIPYKRNIDKVKLYLIYFVLQRVLE